MRKGFIPNRLVNSKSWDINLISSFDEVIDFVIADKVELTDFSKAFNTVPHN